MYKKFEELCEAKGVTPYKVSQDTGIATSTFSEWKNGQYEPKIDKIITLAKYFEVSIDVFLRERVAHERTN